MDLRSRTWSAELAGHLEVPVEMLPRIRRSSEVYGLGAVDGPLPGVPVAAALGDQHAALVGQGCFEPGASKSTYGTGGFLLCNTGDEIVRSEHGLLSTVAYQLGDGPPCYALEGSVAVAGSLIQWLRDRLELIRDVAEVEPLAASVVDSGGAYVVPAFSGFSLPVGGPTRVESSPASRHTRARRTSCAPRSRPPASKPARSSRRCVPTPATRSAS